MPCLLVLLTVAFPRVVLLILFFFTTYLQKAYVDFLWPLLGFIFLPLTTITYAWVINSHAHVEGVYLVAMVVSVLADLGLLGSHRVYRR